VADPVHCDTSVPAINAAWLLCGGLTALAVVLVVWVRRSTADQPVAPE
jgi:hypothetical protein